MSSRPGYILDIDNESPAIVNWAGDQLHRQPLPAGSQVIYAPEPLVPLPNPSRAIVDVLANPTDSAPLSELFAKKPRTVIVFDDSITPVPSMHRPDARQIIIESVLEQAADHGIGELTLLVARGLHRRMTENELRHVIGDRVYESFAPNHALVQHDVERDGNVALGTDGIEIAPELAAAELIISIAVRVEHNWTIDRTLASTVTSYATATNPAITDTDVVTALEADGKTVLRIEAVLNTNVWPSALSLLQKREPDWNLKDQIAFVPYRHRSTLRRRQLGR